MKWIKIHTRGINLLAIQSSTYGYIHGLKKVLGRSITGRLIYFQNKIFSSYDLLADNQEFKRIFTNQYKKGKFCFFRNIINKYPKFYSKILEITKGMAKEDSANLSNKVIADILKGYRHHIGTLFTFIVIPRKLDELLITEVKNDILKFHPLEETDRIINDSVIPEIESTTRREQKELIKLVLRIKQNRKLNWQRPIIKHWQKYQCLGTYFFGSGKPCSLQYYQSAVKKLKKQSVKELNGKLNKLKLKTAVQKIKLPAKVKAILKILREFSVLKIKTGEFFSYSGFELQKLLQEIAKRSQRNLTEIQYLLFEEIVDFLEKGKKLPDKERIKKRMKECALFVKNGKILLYEGQSVKRLIAKELKFLKKQSTPNLLKGQIVVPGKVQGKVRIIVDLKKLSTMKQGEILVSGMTSVNYISAVKKAKAIVTDEGGITCHAASIAREFNIPCIVGTKIATQVFKDGDWVEVDANKGIVRKL